MRAPGAGGHPSSGVNAGGPGPVEVLERVVAADRVPGLQYVAVDAAGVVTEFAGGRADIEAGVTMTPATTLMAYSMSKTITAVAVLQLAEAGALDLDAPAGRYLDTWPYGEATVRQLLAHTAGAPNPIPLRWVHAADAHAAFDERAALEAVIRKHGRPAFAPGTRYAYSNIGYWLLGGVVERVSGEAFPAYVDGHIVRPLGLGPAELGYAVTNPERHAAGYLERYSLLNLLSPFLVDRHLLGASTGRWRRIRSHYPNGPAFGGLVGTARAFGRFLQDQLGARSVLLGERGRAWLGERQRTRDRALVPMTLGWHVAERHGRRVLYKEGGGGGFHCMMRLYPDDGAGSVLMTNATGFDVAACLHEADRAAA